MTEVPDKHFTHVRFTNFSVHVPTEVWCDSFGLSPDAVASDVREYIKNNLTPKCTDPDKLSICEAKELPALGAFGSGEIKAVWEWPEVRNCWNAFCIGEDCDQQHHHDFTGYTWFERQGATWNNHNNDLGQWCQHSGEAAHRVDDRCPAMCQASTHAED
ncbi:hypothetical protein [Alloactinosynnema sp. L-07]|uniref:hypothetical protein n=1 Tax=Alloactinosynnema sp. L-07 TaxID=1653480 RepID=UPI00065F066A|nr:hypothetical protein [Alloactinosynnema sp. L-07]CRK56958.1 hypothetical protein [Alloactinosynnema sp. L-07]